MMGRQMLLWVRVAVMLAGALVTARAAPAQETGHSAHAQKTASHPKAAQKESAGGEALRLQTTSFTPGGDIPQDYTCSGRNISPALSWNDPPIATQSFAIIVEDPDAPGGTYTHWVAYNLPPGMRYLSQGVPKLEQIPGGGLQGLNDFGKTGYGGPCPPPGKPHRYFFKLYALDTVLKLDSPASKADVERGMRGHVLASAELMGKYHR